MPVISLTVAERDRFAAWLEQEARSSEELSRQAEKLPRSDRVVAQMRSDAAVFLTVAKKLRSIEDMAISQ